MLEFLCHIDLPAHATPGGFDHAAVHGRRQRLYVAHTANDALDVIDCVTHTYVRSVRGLAGVAGALVSEEDLVFMSNRGEDTIGIVSPDRDDVLAKVGVGVGPNGLAYDPRRRLLLAANVGDPSGAGSFAVSMVDVAHRGVIAEVPVAGRTRWAVFDPEADCFYVTTWRAKRSTSFCLKRIGRRSTGTALTMEGSSCVKKRCCSSASAAQPRA